ncbi:hypothetical protein AND_004735 [Anopheles darlingi]|uniref:Immunoglobulin I-set domain-containing protein n=1 Tax=Anopheles darlingi TaxID=43151 RepID=W5JKW0_ANODA|nr:hypothetical protein AND_004735 [Anopheles darlingi]
MLIEKEKPRGESSDICCSHPDECQPTSQPPDRSWGWGRMKSNRAAMNRWPPAPEQNPAWNGDLYSGSKSKSSFNEILGTGGLVHTSRTGDKFETMSRNTGYTKYMSLKIRSVGPTDFGSYRCVAKNSLGETDGLIKLDGRKANKKHDPMMVGDYGVEEWKENGPAIRHPPGAFHNGASSATSLPSESVVRMTFRAPAAATATAAADAMNSRKSFQCSLCDAATATTTVIAELLRHVEGKCMNRGGDVVFVSVCGEGVEEGGTWAGSSYFLGGLGSRCTNEGPTATNLLANKRLARTFLHPVDREDNIMQSGTGWPAVTNPRGFPGSIFHRSLLRPPMTSSVRFCLCIMISVMLAVAVASQHDASGDLRHGSSQGTCEVRGLAREMVEAGAGVLVLNGSLGVLDLKIGAILQHRDLTGTFVLEKRISEASQCTKSTLDRLIDPLSFIFMILVHEVSSRLRNILQSSFSQ